MIIFRKIILLFFLLFYGGQLLANAEYLTGNWGGARQALSDIGVDIFGRLLFFNGYNTAGGKKNGGISVVESELAVGFDTSRPGWWTGGYFYLSTIYRYYPDGKNFSSDYAGSFSAVHPADGGESGFQPGEYWFRQGFLNEKIRLKIGRQDPSKDFLLEPYADIFLNTRFQFIPNVPFPRYRSAESRNSDGQFRVLTLSPIRDQHASSLGVSAFFRYPGWMQTTIGVFDLRPEPDAWLLSSSAIDKKNIVAMTEFSFNTHLPLGRSLDGVYKAGAWFVNKSNYTTQEEASLPEIAKKMPGSAGLYITADQQLFKENKGAADAQGISAFLQYSIATPNWAVQHYFGCGATYRGIIPKRDNDILGVAFSLIDFTAKMKDMFNMKKQEMLFEVIYHYRIEEWLQIDLDFQHLTVPGGIIDTRDLYYMKDSDSFIVSAEILF